MGEEKRCEKGKKESRRKKGLRNEEGSRVRRGHGSE